MATNKVYRLDYNWIEIDVDEYGESSKGTFFVSIEDVVAYHMRAGRTKREVNAYLKDKNSPLYPARWAGNFRTDDGESIYIIQRKSFIELWGVDEYSETARLIEILDLLSEDELYQMRGRA